MTKKLHLAMSSRIRDECLNEYWFTSLVHARVIVEAGRREYNEEWPKRSFGGFRPVADALRLMQNQLNKPRTPKLCATENTVMSSLRCHNAESSHVACLFVLS
ncbi:hypothetical protein BV908_19490 [Diaphorobacter sp. LR2014-1]|nr:hypothetical protein BV908_19490 [Diaphorobacter sp. LR2014-1]